MKVGNIPDKEFNVMGHKDAHSENFNKNILNI